MKNRPILGIALFILFTTIISQNKFTFNKFEIKEIKIENNNILKEQELIQIFSFLYNKNIFFLNSYELKKNIDQKSFIKKVEIKKIFPNKLVIKVFEKEPIAILIDKNQKKFYLDKKIDLIEYNKILEYKNLPVVIGEQKSFRKLFINLIKINFPVELILNYRLLNLNRWIFFLYCN